MSYGDEEGGVKLIWKVTWGNDDTIIETFDPKKNLLGQLLKERVKVEAILGTNTRTRNLKLLAYCLKAKNQEAQSTEPAAGR